MTLPTTIDEFMEAVNKSDMYIPIQDNPLYQELTGEAAKKALLGILYKDQKGLIETIRIQSVACLFLGYLMGKESLMGRESMNESANDNP